MRFPFLLFQHLPDLFRLMNSSFLPVTENDLPDLLLPCRIPGVGYPSYRILFYRLSPFQRIPDNPVKIFGLAPVAKV